MEDFYSFLTKFTKNDSGGSIKALADRVKDEKELVIFGLHHDETWNGRTFSWGGQNLLIWVSEKVINEEVTLWLLIRGDLMPHQILHQIFINMTVKTNKRNAISVASKHLINGDLALELTLKSNETTVSIEFADLVDEGKDRRKLSIPVTGIVLITERQKNFSDKLLSFWSQTHLFDRTRGVARFVGEDNDAIADYFISIMEEARG